MRVSRAAILALGLVLALCAPVGAQTDPLPSWNDSPAKQAILEFVRVTTDQASQKFVPPAARIAVFDNDGTLWSEQPMYFQGFFAFDRVKAWRPNTRTGRRGSPSRASSRTT